jgi:hypothetical protein
MRRLAEVAHKHDIPITWGIGATAARAFATDLTEWHTSHGDEIALMVNIAPIWGSKTDSNDLSQSAEHIVTMREKLPGYISSERDRVQKPIEWANPIVAGSVQKNHVLLYALAEVGFSGLWGYDWKNKADDGCPFGCFFPSADKHNFCGTSTSRIVGLPHTSLLPTQTTRKSEETENTDLQFQVSNGAMQQGFDCYAANAEWNQLLAYIQRIDPVEVASLTPEQLDGLDTYFAYVSEAPETQILSLPDVVRTCQETGEQTQPTFLLDEAKLEGEEEVSTDSDKPIFSYYDAECQLIFEAGKIEPIQVTNYISPPVSSRNGAEVNIPQIEQFRPSRSRSQLRMQFTIESTKAVPYGLAVWGNHAGLTLASSNAQEVTWLGDRLLFVRVNLQAGKNEVEVVLTI